MKTPRYLNVPGRRVMLPRKTSGLFTLRWLALNHQPRNVQQRVITSELPAKASGREGPWARGERPGYKSGSPRPYRQRRIRYSCYRLLGSRQFTRSSQPCAYAVWALLIPKVNNLYRCTYDRMSMNKEVWTIHNLALARELIMTMGLYWPFVLFNNEKQSPFLNKHNLNQFNGRVVWPLYKVGYFLNRLLGPFGFTLLDRQVAKWRKVRLGYVL